MYDKNKVELKHYTSLNLFQVWDNIKKNKQDEIFLDLDNFDKFKAFVKFKDYFYIVYYDNKMVGFFWVDDMDFPCSCNIHFGIFKLKYALKIGAYILSWLRETFNVVRGDINKNNIFAKKFLTKLGFKSIGIIPNYYKKENDLDLYYYR